MPEKHGNTKDLEPQWIYKIYILRLKASKQSDWLQWVKYFYGKTLYFQAKKSCVHVTIFNIDVTIKRAKGQILFFYWSSPHKYHIEKDRESYFIALILSFTKNYTKNSIKIAKTDISGFGNFYTVGVF